MQSQQFISNLIVINPQSTNHRTQNTIAYTLPCHGRIYGSLGGRARFQAGKWAELVIATHRMQFFWGGGYLKLCWGKKSPIQPVCNFGSGSVKKHKPSVSLESHTLVYSSNYAYHAVQVILAINKRKLILCTKGI